MDMLDVQILECLDQALKSALSVQEAEKQEIFSESFYTSFDTSL